MISKLACFLAGHNVHPFKQEVRLHGEKPRDRYVEDWELVEMLSLPAHRAKGSVRAIGEYIRLKLLTGLRRGDLLRLTVSDLKDDGISPWFFCNRRGQGYLDESARRQPGDREGVPAENRESGTVEVRPEPAEMKPCREAFERWWSPLYDRSLERNGDGYSLMQTQLAWDAWKNSWNTRTPPAAPVAEDAEDAVEALTVALAKSSGIDDYTIAAPEQIIEYLVAKGYTLRRETMTEAELEREAKQVAMTVSALGFDRFGLIIELAKKFRG